MTVAMVMEVALLLLLARSSSASRSCSSSASSGAHAIAWGTRRIVVGAVLLRFPSSEGFGVRKRRRRRSNENETEKALVFFSFSFWSDETLFWISLLCCTCAVSLTMDLLSSLLRRE